MGAFRHASKKWVLLEYVRQRRTTRYFSDVAEQFPVDFNESSDPKILTANGRISPRIEGMGFTCVCALRTNESLFRGC